MGKRRAELLAHGALPDPDRTGLFTTGIVSITAAGPIALFFSGRKHMRVVRTSRRCSTRASPSCRRPFTCAMVSIATGRAVTT